MRRLARGPDGHANTGWYTPRWRYLCRLGGDELSWSGRLSCKTQTGEFSLPVPFVVFSIFFSNSVMCRRAHTCVSPVFVVVAALLLKAGMIIFASNGEERQKVLKNTRVYIVVL